VLLNIEQEVSSVAQKQATGTANLGPTFDTRTVKNAVLVKSGETVVLGGLMDEQTQEQISKVPLLGDIPVLGYLFRSSKTSTAKRNLMVFIRPTIFRDANVYSGVSSNKYTLFRAEQLSRAAEEGYATSPARQVLPAYGQDAADWRGVDQSDGVADPPLQRDALVTERKETIEHEGTEGVHGEGALGPADPVGPQDVRKPEFPRAAGVLSRPRFKQSQLF
jgi:hypothetical protein